MNELPRIAVVLPILNEEKHIVKVLREIPPWVQLIVAVDDGSTDSTAFRLKDCAEHDPRIDIIVNQTNRGVGAATIRGFERAIAKKAEVIVKMDGDGQMGIEDLPDLIYPLIDWSADLSKGNRFRNRESVTGMPRVRWVGNLALSFLVKVASGYWNVFDPTNGFIAIRREAWLALNRNRLAHGYFFEISLLAEMYLAEGVVCDIPMKARYRDEQSSLVIRSIVPQFVIGLIKCLQRRILFSYFWRELSVASVYIVIGTLLLLFGIIFGLTNWAYFGLNRVPAPTGTVVLPSVALILAVEFLVAAIRHDLDQVPRNPIAFELANKAEFRERIRCQPLQ